MKKSLRYFVTIIVSFLFVTGVVEAKDAKAVCSYEIPFGASKQIATTVTFTYNRTKDTFQLEKKNKSQYLGVNLTNKISKNNFIDENDKLYCPYIYAKSELNHGSQSVNVTLYRDADDGRKRVGPKKDEVTNAGGKPKDTMNCGFNTDDGTQISITLDKKKEEVKSVLRAEKELRLDDDITYRDFVSSDGNSCSVKEFYLTCASNGNQKYCLLSKNKKGNGGSTTEKTEADMNNPGYEEQTSYYAEIEKKKYVCGGFVSDNLLREINRIYKTMSLIAVIGAIILGVLDFLNAVSSDDDGALKKAWSKFIKRIVIVVLIILLPILLQFLLSIFGDANMKSCLDKIK